MKIHPSSVTSLRRLALEPVLQQAPGDREARRQPQRAVATGDGIAHVGAIETTARPRAPRRIRRGSPERHGAVKPSISEVGNGHGWDARYSGGPTSTPASSRTSRATASSRLSPGSDEAGQRGVESSGPPAMCRWRPSSTRSPSGTSMITTGSVRGWCWAPQRSQRRTDPALDDRRRAAAHRTMGVSAVQFSSAAACAASPASSGGSAAATARRPSTCVPAAGAAVSTANTGPSASSPSSSGSVAVELGQPHERDPRVARGSHLDAVLDPPAPRARSGSAAWAASHAGSPRRSATRSRLPPVNVIPSTMRCQRNDVARWPGPPPTIPPQAGRTIVVTGATSGLGYHTRRASWRAPAPRSCSRCRDTARGEEVREQTGAAAVVRLDLADLASVKTAASELRTRWQRLDVLVNNAGVMGPPRRLTPDRFELQMATNHFGPFALTGLLLDTLRDGRRGSRSPAARTAAAGSPSTTSRASAATTAGACTRSPSSPTCCSPSSSVAAPPPPG